MSEVLIDTNIIYYLSGYSLNENFKIELFKNDKHNIIITFFSLIEILSKKLNKKELKKILLYLKSNCETIIKSKDIKISMDNIFGKCANSNFKRKHIKNLLLKSAIEYFSDLMSEILLLLGGIYSGSLQKKDSDESYTAFSRSINVINKVSSELKALACDKFINMLEKYYTYNQDDKYIKKQFNSLMTELLKMYNLIYTAFLKLDVNSLHFDQDFNNLKKQKIESNITQEDLQKAFKKYSNPMHFNKKFNKLYENLFPKHLNTLRSEIVRNLMRKYLISTNFSFNDIVDAFNILCFYDANKEHPLFYLTNDKEWINFMNETKNYKKFEENLSFIKKYINL